MHIRRNREMDNREAKKSSSCHSLGGINMIRAVMMSILMLLCIGYVFLWIIRPTNLYKLHWQPKIRDKTKSTYFGTKEGPNILLFTFPILLIATLGCIYVHLGTKKCDDDKMIGTRLRLLLEKGQRPVIVRRIGIISWIEIIFFIMFIALLIWSYSIYLHIDFAKITPESAAQSGEKVWQAKLNRAALRLGVVGNIVLAFLFFPVTRGSSVLQIFHLTSEASIKYHIWLGHIVMNIITAHGVCYIIYWAVTHQLSQMLKWKKTGVSNIAGEITLLAALAMWVATFRKIRRKKFEVFFYTHHLYIVFIIFFVFHVGISYACMMLPSFYLFMIDRYLRFLQSRQHVRLFAARVLPCETVELNFSKTKGVLYAPTSIIFIHIPSISKLQWHPYTITSSSNLEHDRLSVMIKGEGSWGKKLYQILSSPNSIERLDVSVEGPYGPTSTDFLRHDLLVMVSGGSGITPFISIIRDLVSTSETSKCHIPEVLLITAFKYNSDLSMLDIILPISGAPPKFSELRLQIEAYVTDGKQSATQAETQDKTSLTTVWFKPKTSDAPIATVLGKNNWLWLGAIISSSFIIFLLSMGLMTRYYIYPIDKNTNKIYPYVAKAALNMLLICLAIMITATTAFIWNKKGNANETRQTQNMEGGTPNDGSQHSTYYNAERELESLPIQSLAQSTKIHYGERPNIKRILFDRTESSVGVLVCGPRKMSHDVAKICSSGLADNLHFELISFNW